MQFQRITLRELPDGTVAKVYPFHISLEGMESVLLCRDDEDFDVMQKYFHVCSWVNNVLVIIDIEMSNHGHLAVLADSLDSAVRAGEAIKKNHSQYISHKYGEKRVLARSDVKVLYLDSDKYLRNALAYIPRNALDAGCRIEDYRWSSYNAMFAKGRSDISAMQVSALSRRDKESIFHTHADLSRVPWKISTGGLLLPETACEGDALWVAVILVVAVHTVGRHLKGQVMDDNCDSPVSDARIKGLVSRKALFHFRRGR